MRELAELRPDTVIFDDELTPGQLRNLEKACLLLLCSQSRMAWLAVQSKSHGMAWHYLTCTCSELQQLAPCRVADRAALVIDIFSQAAKTKEGQLQVHACSARESRAVPAGCLQRRSCTMALCAVCARCTWRSWTTSCPG